MRAAGQPVPDHIRAPSLSNELWSYFSAYQEIATDRQIGMSVGPIPYSAIVLYGERNGFDDREDFARLVKAVRALDAVYMKDVAKKMKAK